MQLFLEAAKRPRETFIPSNLRDLVCGKGGSWGEGEVGGGFYSPPEFPNRAGLRGPKLGLCCPLVPGRIPRTQLLPLPPTWMGMCVQECTDVWVPPDNRG